ncbi:MAG TPA: VTT domain-containing protein [Polyangia bacterium]|nr:VTT domain-containing protein [Polyangia bacterium]
MSTLGFVFEHRYALLFAAVFLSQLGVPFPALPVLLGAGALARDGRLDLAAALALSIAASVITHAAWYEAGRRRGRGVLAFLCRFSLEPDVCVRQTTNLFARRGAAGLIVAHFIPGVSLVAQPLAGINGVTPSAFLLYSGLGAALWAGGLLGAGYALGRQLEQATRVIMRIGLSLGALVAASLAVYVAWKLVKRRLFLRDLRLARISPDELKRALDAGEAVVIVDLRHAHELTSEPRTIPGALRITAEELDERHHEIPAGREIILYCS